MAFNTEIFQKLKDNGSYDFDFLYFEEIDSTNDFAKKAQYDKCGKVKVIISSYQSRGKGRLGRRFISKKDKGIYFSVITSNLDEDHISLLTVAAAVCVCETLERETGDKFDIKWVNDILYENKKICGILTENAIDTSTGTFERSIVGIGVNLYGTIDSELKNIASTVEEMTGKTVSCEKTVFDIVCGLTNYFSCTDTRKYLEKYRQRCTTLGKRITVNNVNEKYSAKAIEIDEQGRLVVETNGRISALNSGEVSVLPQETQEKEK